MQTFNIALFPQDKQLIDQCIKLAQSNFSVQAEEYLLGDNASPHITLCQFDTAPSRIEEVWSSVASLQSKPLAVKFDHIHIWPGRNDHIGKYWLGLAVNKEEPLMALQLAVYEKLMSLKVMDPSPDSHYFRSNYFPHLTWARCNGSKPLGMPVLPSPEFWTRSYLFSLSLGESGTNGMYRKQLFPPDK